MILKIIPIVLRSLRFYLANPRYLLEVLLVSLGFRKKLNLENFRAYKGEIDCNKRKIACVFAHFDRHNIIDDYVVYYLKKLEELGCAIFFVSTCENMVEDELSKITGIVSKAIIRKNEGYDFGSYAVGLNFITKYENFDKILIANDSVYGPFSDLNQLLKKMDEEGAEVFGATDNWTFTYHLQSYFLILNRKVLLNKAVENFWNNLSVSSHRLFIIKQYEVGFSQLLIKQGFVLKAYCQHTKIVSLLKNSMVFKHKTPLEINLTLSYWNNLLVDFGYPFIKLELLRDNPAKVQNTLQFREILQNLGVSSKLVEIIDNHLKRSRQDKFK